MAIHPTVFYSPDRRLRITADPGGRSFTVESNDGLVHRRFASLAALQDFLGEEGIKLGDLIED